MAPTPTLAGEAVTAMEVRVAVVGGVVFVELLPPPPQAANRPVRPSKNRAPRDPPGRHLRAKRLAEIGIMSTFPCGDYP